MWPPYPRRNAAVYSHRIPFLSVGVPRNKTPECIVLNRDEVRQRSVGCRNLPVKEKREKKEKKTIFKVEEAKPNGHVLTKLCHELNNKKKIVLPFLQNSFQKRVRTQQSDDKEKRVWVE